MTVVTGSRRDQATYLPRKGVYFPPWRKFLLLGSGVVGATATGDTLGSGNASQQADGDNEASRESQVLQVRSNLNLELLCKLSVVNTQGPLDTRVDILKLLAEASRQILHLLVVHGQAKGNRGQEQQRDSRCGRSTNTLVGLIFSKTIDGAGSITRLGDDNRKLSLVTILIGDDNLALTGLRAGRNGHCDVTFLIDLYVRSRNLLAVFINNYAGGAVRVLDLSVDFLALTISRNFSSLTAVVVVDALLMAGDRNSLDNRLIQRRIIDRHRNRTINILTRLHRDRAILTNGDRNILPILISSGSSGLIGLILNLQTRILTLISRIHRLRITLHSQWTLFRGRSSYLGGSFFGQALTVDIGGCLDFRTFSLRRNACREGTGVLSVFLRNDNGAIRKLNPDICARLCLNSHSLAVGGQRLNRRGLRLLNRLIGSDNRLLRDCNLAGRGLSHSLVLTFVLDTGDASNLGDTLFSVLPVEINGSYGLIEVDSDFAGLGVGGDGRLRNERNLYLRIVVGDRNLLAVIILEDFLRNIDDEVGIRGLDLRCFRLRSAYLVAARVLRISLILQNFLTIRNTVTIGIELGGVGAELGLVGIEKAVAIGICQAEVGVGVGILENIYGRATVSLIEDVGVNPASKIDVSAGCFLDTFQCPVLELVLDRDGTGLTEVP